MHWEKEIRIRITWRRIVGTILAASTVANLVIAGAAYGADAPPAPINTSVTLTSLPTSTVSMPGATAVETSALAAFPGITPTDTFTPTQMANDAPGWFCIKKFYWPSYYVQPGDKLFRLALNTGSSVGELIAANCLTNDWIYAGQRLYVPRLPILPRPTSTATSTLTQMPTATETPTETATLTDTVIPSATMTNTYTTPTQTLTYTPTATPSPTKTMLPTPTDIATDVPSATPTSTDFISGSLCDQAEFVADVTIPPGTILLSGTAFTKTWSIKNTGSCTWTTSYAIVHVSGERFGAPDALLLPMDVAPGQIIDVSIRMTAPQKGGQYFGYWMLRNSNGGYFSVSLQERGVLPVQIEVAEIN
jgi:LysM repeat protein